MFGADLVVFCRDRPEDPRGGGGAVASVEVRLRRAVRGDCPFAEGLYVANMRPLLEELGAWNEAEIVQRFRAAVRLRDSYVILVGGRQAGWLQVHETRAEIELVQLHLVPDRRKRGVGSLLLRRLLADAASKNKPVILNCVENNPACKLYSRLGFVTVQQAGYKLKMRWERGVP